MSVDVTEAQDHLAFPTFTISPSPIVLHCVYGFFTQVECPTLLLVKKNSLNLYDLFEDGHMELLCEKNIDIQVRDIVRIQGGDSPDSLVISTELGLYFVKYDTAHVGFEISKHHILESSTKSLETTGKGLVIDPLYVEFLLAVLSLIPQKSSSCMHGLAKNCRHHAIIRNRASNMARLCFQFYRYHNRKLFPPICSIFSSNISAT